MIYCGIKRRVLFGKFWEVVKTIGKSTSQFMTIFSLNKNQDLEITIQKPQSLYISLVTKSE